MILLQSFYAHTNFALDADAATTINLVQHFIYAYEKCFARIAVNYY